jgi:hypothetical protein
MDERLVKMLLREIAFFWCWCWLLLVLGLRSLSADQPPVPDNAHVTLQTDQDEYFLGENVLVHYKLENSGGESFPAEFGGDYRGAARALRFKVTVLDEKRNPLADPYPNSNCMGGMGGTVDVTPYKPFYASLPIVRYARFDRPGTYQITVHHDGGWEAPPMNAYPEGQVTLRLKQPTEEEAAQLVNKWLAAGEYSGNTFGEKAEPHADFSQIRFGVYLAPLIEPAKQGNQNALVGIGSICTPEATRVLIDLVQLHRANQVEMAKAACAQLCQRLPDPYLQGELGKRNPFEDGLLEPRRWLVAKAWRAEFSTEIRELAVEMLLEGDSHWVATGAYMLECVGTKADAPALIAALDLEVKNTLGMKVRTDLYPRPRGACLELQRAATMLLKRGLIPPDEPQSPGECILFAIELKRDTQFRPADWLATSDRLLQHEIPYIQEQMLKHLPEPMPAKLRHHLAKVLSSTDIDAMIEACHIVEREKLVEFREPILKILSSAKEDWLFSAADNAAIALETKYDRIQILVSRLDDPEMVFPCLNSLKSIFSNTGGGGWSSNIDVQAEARRIKPLWEAFIAQHAVELKAGEQFKLPHSAVSAEMFPEQFTISLLSGGNWPDRE